MKQQLEIEEPAPGVEGSPGPALESGTWFKRQIKENKKSQTPLTSENFDLKLFSAN